MRMHTKKNLKQRGFTLFEVILVMVIIVIMAGVTAPFIGGALKGTALKTSARLVMRMSNYARSMAIMKNKEYSLVINEDMMEIYLGSKPSNTSTNETDGKIDQDVLKRLGYKDADNTEQEEPTIEKEVKHRFPDNISLADIEIESDEEDKEDSRETDENLHIIHYYVDGKSDKFTLELEDNRGIKIELESDPISGKIKSSFLH